MSWRIALVAAAVALFGPSLFCQQFEVPEWAGMHWYKGNTNTHTDVSDGDASGAEVAAWYKAHGYDFVVITDHDVLVSGHPGSVDLGGASGLADSSFLVVPGVEVSARYTAKPVHVGALNVSRVILRLVGSTLVDTLERNVSAVREAGGVPVVFHPNSSFLLNQDVLLAVSGYSLLEVFNGSPTAQNEGLAGSPSVERMWDHLLSAGKRIYGVAADSAYFFKGVHSAAWPAVYPGTGWVVARARSLNAEEIIGNLERGLFYASTGVVLDDVVVEAQRIEVRIRQAQATTYRTEFIGAAGQVLLETTANPAVYGLAGGEKYVRAMVTDSSKRRAWVQPVFVRR